MKFTRVFILLTSHIIAVVLGFAIGIYTLPIILAPEPPSRQDISAVAKQKSFEAKFKRDLEDSDPLHWGEGIVYVGAQEISHMGRLSPGPDYKLYLSPTFLETEEAFEREKPGMALIGDVKTFNGFLLMVPPDVNTSDYNTVVIWCERFGEFITAAKYQ